jgi:hypothetical protein
MPPVSKLSLNQPGSRPAGTSIPVLRREKRKNSIAAAAVAANNAQNSEDGAAKIKPKDTRWDALTGEPTTSDRGRPPQVKPGEFLPPGSYVEDGMGVQTTVTSAPKTQTSFGDRVRKLKDTSIMGAGGNRPEWKGSSGRTKVVPPVADQLDIPPLHLPRKSSKAATSPPSGDPGRIAAVSLVSGSPAVTPAVSSTMVPANSRSYPTIKPIIPSNMERNGPSPFSGSPTTMGPSPQQSSRAAQANPTPIYKDSRPPKKSVAPPTTSQPTRGSTYPAPSNNPSGPRAFPSSATVIERTNTYEPYDPYNEPPSRFSTTTYATSAASTPRPSSDSTPPLPPPHQNSPNNSRSRPRNSSGDSIKATTRKALPVSGEGISAPVFISMAPGASTRGSIDLTSSAASVRNSKMLPKSPPEAASLSLTQSLQAQIDDLSRQRNNLQKSIHQMTELMPVDGQLGTEARRREEEKRKVELLREDLADISRLEHEIGLKLHRARKRQDQDAVYEPTSLWVRRVGT